MSSIIQDKDKRKEYRRMMRKKIRQTVNETIGTPVIDQSIEGVQLLKYEKDGEFDYELYRSVQEMGNKQKLNFQWVPEDHIVMIAGLVQQQDKVKFGLCHGTRQGLEQKWFKQVLGDDVEVVGTEISETATEFPDTIQWDFHEVKDEWVGNTDFIYSNSWDHTYDPNILFPAWISCLKVGGRLYLDHSRDQSGETVNVLDPFGAKEEVFVDLLNKIGDKKGKVVAIEQGVTRRNGDLIKVVVFERTE